MDYMEPDQGKPVETILDSACKVFARFGFKKATMEDIAKGAGLKKPSLYYYFGSKEEIFSAVIKRESRELVSIMKAAAAEKKSVKDKLEAVFFERYRYFKEKKSLYSVSQEHIDEISTLASKARNNFVELEIDILSGILEEGISSGEIEIEDPRLFAMVAIASLQGIDRTFWLSGLEERIEAGVYMMMNIFYKGVRKE